MPAGGLPVRHLEAGGSSIPGGSPIPSERSRFDAWEVDGDGDARSPARLSIARGQALFNTRAFSIENVSGLNDELGMASIGGTCTTCHNAPNLGNNSEGLRFDIGIADARRRPPELPLYTLERRGTGETVQTLDPGRALVSGRWRDVGRFKVPTLRGLAARAPYFHDGSAVGLAEVIEYLDDRFSIQLTAEERVDLAAFLGAL
jgi:cytochrome c peroxidase